MCFLNKPIDHKEEWEQWKGQLLPVALRRQLNTACVSQPLTLLPPIYKVKKIQFVMCYSGAEGSGISPVCPAAPAKSSSDWAQ